MAIEITGKFKPKNGKTFAIVDAADVEMPNGGRLPDYMPVAITQADYDKLVADGTVNEKTPYLIVEGGEK